MRKNKLLLGAVTLAMIIGLIFAGCSADGGLGDPPPSGGGQNTGVQCAHVMVFVELIEPTCQSEGYTLLVCGNDCGHEDIIDIVSMEDHVWGSWRGFRTEDLCSFDGRIRTCNNNCGAYEHDGGDNFVRHRWGAWDIIEPKCKEAGEKTRECLRDCGFTCREDKRVLDPTGCDLEDKDGKGATCIAAGYSEFKKCATCGDEVGKSNISPLGHNFPASWTTVNAATCLAPGLDKRDCERCDYFETNTIGSPAHDQGWTVTSEGKFAAISCAKGCNATLTLTRIVNNWTTSQSLRRDLTEAVIPANVTNIDASAFTGNDFNNLVSVTFTNGSIILGNNMNNDNNSPFNGDLKAKFRASGGGVGTYIRNGNVWTKQ